jgi:RNA polymerase sigma-70 factor (sigma-E family)
LDSKRVEVDVRGDPGDDFDSYVALRAGHLLKLAYLLTGNAADAEELVQESLTRIFLAWRKVVAADDRDAYVRRVVVNANQRRFRRRRVTEVFGQEREGCSRADDQSMVEDRQHLAGLLAELPDRQRLVVVLRYYEDLSEAVVANLLGCSVGTVKSQASKALAKLRAHVPLDETVLYPEPHGAARA